VALAYWQVKAEEGPLFGPKGKELRKQGKTDLEILAVQGVDTGPNLEWLLDACVPMSLH
jgi:hypothetical protein